MVHSTNEVLLHPDDLIADNELRSADKDKLAHERIAAQLAALVTTVPAQSNIALYGPWGSGKSSVANMLRSKLVEQHSRAGRGCRDGDIRFARFDAFKYAETPLRRNFISAIASELGIRDHEFHEGLYSGKTSTTIEMPLKRGWQVAKIFGTLLALLAVIVLTGVAMIAFARHGDFSDNFRTAAGSAVVAGLLPATLLTGLIALASKPLQVERKTERPESDEQFEQLFAKLVTKSRASLLVVFVDELDRCSATTVASTLDTIRTFFRAEKCVFVVAADRRVLEEALTCAEQTQQTPVDTINPYYSTGSAYLDKMFQYQVSLPPLLPHRVTQFALDQVQGRGGVWSEINAPYVVSVLVPTHVASPRRVKHLLNTFALTYRTAQDRHRQNLLTEDPRDNAGAVAKMVCLSVEFPLFARDLEIDARLPQYVLELKAHPDDPDALKPGSASDMAWELAQRYALGKASPAFVIASDAEPNPSSGEPATTTVTKAHAKQLIDYLTRTRDINGPSRDLVFLHSAGTAFGLSGELAMAIEQAAENGSVDDIGLRVAALSEPEQEAALKLLIQQINTGIGLGVTNAARALVTLTAAHQELPIHTVADSAAAAINHALRELPGELLDEETAPAIWALAKHGTEGESKALRRTVLAVIQDDAWESDAGFVLSDPMPALESDPQAFGAIVAREVVSDEPAAAVRRLGALNNSVLGSVLAVAGPPIKSTLVQDLSAYDQWRTAQAKSSETATTTSEDEPAEPYDPKPCITALAELARDRAESSSAISHDLVALLLRCQHKIARDAVQQTLTAMEPTTDPDLITLILDAAQHRAVDEQRVWLDAIEHSAIAQQHRPQLHRHLESLWQKTVEAAPHDDIEEVLNRLATLMKACAEVSAGKFSITDLAVGEVAKPFGSSTEATLRAELLTRLEPFVSANTIDTIEVGRALISAVHEALKSAWTRPPHDDGFLTFLDSSLAPLVSVVAQTGRDEELLGKLLTAVKTCSWLPDVGKTRSLLVLIDATHGIDLNTAITPTPAEILDLVAVHGRPAVDVCTRWTALTRPSVGELEPIIEYLIIEHLLTPGFADAVAQARSDWTEADRTMLVTKHLLGHDQSLPSPDLLKTIGLAQLKDSSVAELLIERFAACTTNPQRRTVTDLWIAANITDNRARRRLLELIILPLLSADNGTVNKGKIELALEALAKIGPPPEGVRQKLVHAINDAIADDARLAAKARTLAETFGWETTQTGFFLRRRTRVSS